MIKPVVELLVETKWMAMMSTSLEVLQVGLY
jgi:hypothetical protein